VGHSQNKHLPKAEPKGCLFKVSATALHRLMPLEQDLKDSEVGEKHQTEIFLLLSKPPVSFKRGFDEYPSFFSPRADQFSSQLSYKRLFWSYNLVLKLSIDKISRTQLFSERT
jgi:hypothetical protein